MGIQVQLHGGTSELVVLAIEFSCRLELTLNLPIGPSQWRSDNEYQKQARMKPLTSLIA